jgi:hypothetical protein
MEEVAPAPGQEVASARGPLPQQDLLVWPVGTVESEAVELPTGVPEEGAPEVEAPAPGAPSVEMPAPEPPTVEAATLETSTADVPAPGVPATEGPATAEGQAPVVLTLDDTPLDKGKQAMGVEGGEATDQAGASTVAGAAGAAVEADPSVGPGDALAASSSSWPDIAALVIARAEEEIPRWGGPSLQFRDAANPDAEPIFTLNDGDEVHRWQYLKGVHRHLDRILHVASDAVSRGIRDATEVRSIC